MAKTAVAKPVRKRIEEQIAEQVVQTMAEGGLPPWEKNWSYAPHSVARNGKTGRPYRGVNVLITEMVRGAKGYGDPRWVTYRQAQEMGRQVNKGEKSTTIVYWKFNKDTGNNQEAREKLKENKTAEGNEGEPETPPRLAPLAREYKVFNIEQTRGENPLEQLEPPLGAPPEQAFAAAEGIIAGWKDRPELRTEQGNLPPRYMLDLDLILVPERSRYEDPGEYYTSVFHEMIHATGNPKRLGRKMGNRQDLHEYGREEMVAGIGAAMLCGRAGLRQKNVQRDASYVEGWKNLIQADQAAVIYAAQKAQQACDLILGENPLETKGTGAKSDG